MQSARRQGVTLSQQLVLSFLKQSGHLYGKLQDAAKLLRMSIFFIYRINTCFKLCVWGELPAFLSLSIPDRDWEKWRIPEGLSDCL